MAGLTFLRVVGNDELARQEKEAAERALQEWKAATHSWRWV